jgi:primosomal protein N' (replication factor Y)
MPKQAKLVRKHYAEITLTPALNLHTPSTPPIVIQVALDTPLDRLFDYLAQGATEADIGRRVWVPFGHRSQAGVITGLVRASSVPEAQLKPATEIDRRMPPLPAEILQLARFAAGYYQQPLGTTLLSLLPPALKRQHFRPARPRAYRLTPAGEVHCLTLPARATAQRNLAERLSHGPAGHAELSDLRATLRDWLQRGLAEPTDTLAHSAHCGPMPTLTPAQQDAADAILAAGPGFAAWLLHGVTGSGKTEVYLRLIERTLARGEQALVLAPEIHLTPQLTERFQQRFPDKRLVSLHSGLADGERLAGWLACAEGRADIVLGTRLSVFTPLPRLGLILIDEEHDTSYKQMDGLRYHARDVGVWRARQRGVPIVLGSATPALESWRNAQVDRYRLLSLPERAHAAATLPTIQMIDTRTDRARHGLSAALANALRDTLARGEQSLVFINRRGFAPTLYCQQCGHISPCPRCSANLVVHRLRHGFQLRCHHCGLATRPPETCPDCGGMDLRPFGQGTQKLEDTLIEEFPEARILRIDRDTTARKGAFAEMREAIAARQVDILVGTQIVAKGHDFPHLTLVGVVGADQALMSADFRAGERLFAQLMQVAGRAGRAEHAGRVLIQTDYPYHPLYAALVAHDYPGFAKRTLKERREAEFPPYVHQAMLRAEARDMAEAMAFLGDARRLGLTEAGPVVLYDPVPALMTRVSNWERAQLLVQCRNRQALQSFLSGWMTQLRARPARQIRWHLDVDPLDF